MEFDEYDVQPHPMMTATES